MNSYSALAQYYDQLTNDVPYDSFLSLYMNAFSKDGGDFKLILDLCCGTGTMSQMLTRAGYDVIAVDASEDMLVYACEKAPGALFLKQNATKLDLYGTVDACICSLDSINYIKREDFNKVLKRLHLFIRPGGLFIFDIRPEAFLRNMDGRTSVDETDDLLALWRADFYEKQNVLSYGVDLFTREGLLWKRCSEQHIEYVYTDDFIANSLSQQGFSLQNTINIDNERTFYVSKRA